MTKLTLLFRNLRYFGGVNIAVVLGMAVATAVLTGALMVGDSVRASLADLARRRLGPVDYALISTRFFNQSLAELMNRNAAGIIDELVVVAPAIIVPGGAATKSGDARTADVQIAAIGAPSRWIAPIGGSDLLVARGTSIVNGELASSLGLSAARKDIKLSVPVQSDSPRESALAQGGINDVVNPLPVAVKRIETQQDFIALFNPNGSQRVSRNAWVNLNELQEQTEQMGRVNALLVAAASSHPELPESANSYADALNERLRRIVQLNDYGLRVTPVGNDEASVFARETYIHPAAVEAASRAAAALHIPLRKVSVNLLNEVSKLSADPAKQKSIYSAVAAGVSFLPDGVLADGEIAINEWAAERLDAKEGDTLRIDFALRQPGGMLIDASKALPSQRLTFTVKYVLRKKDPRNAGLGFDSHLPPSYKGMTNVKKMADWKPPAGLMPPDWQKRITKADEDYFRQYSLAPKVFLSFATATKLWGGVYGDVTGLRVPMKDGIDFEKRFLSEIDPKSMGMVFRPIKAEQLAAASGGTDFGEFFLMFSFFLIVAAALLVAMLFRLSVEQRARQLGLMSAVGFSPAVLRRFALGEGMMLALVGSVIGLGGAIGYTSLIMYGLRTWWIGAIGTTSMTLHVMPLTLVYGWVGSLFVAFFAILWAVWRIGKAQPARLLAGGWGTDIRKRGDGRWTRWGGIAALAIGLLMVAISLTGKVPTTVGFGGGGLLLCGSLTWLASALRPRRHAGASFAGSGSITRLGIRNATRHTARGVLAVGLIGIAAFALITVSALRQQGVQDPDDRQSGTGGYRLILAAGIPLSVDLNTAEGRRLVGMKGAEADDPSFKDVQFTMLRRWAGQDISCLNLTRPNSPTILGLPPEMIQRGGFVPKDKNKIWQLLDSDQGGQFPVIADGDTAEYVLKVSKGDTLAITDALNIPRKLKLVATIDHSIFQGQLLMSDANFRKLFPAQSGFGMALIETRPGAPAGTEERVAKRLGSALAAYSVSVDTTAARLQTYQDVQNTYLDTFQALGALGLMLGTLGLAVVLVRTVIERKAELALLASLGFPTIARVKLVLAENAFLLVLGLLLGAGSAVIGILPTVLREARPINVPMLAMTLGIVLVVGLFSSAVAVALSGVRVAPADLRRE